MSNRLDQQKEQTLQPKRMQYAIDKIRALGLPIITKTETELIFMYGNNKIHFFPYSGWHSGSGIQAGRGLNKLLNQLK